MNEKAKTNGTMDEVLGAYPGEEDPVEKDGPVETSSESVAKESTESAEPVKEPVKKVEETPVEEPVVEETVEGVEDDDVPLDQLDPKELVGLVTTLRGQLSDAAAGSFFRQTAEELSAPTPKETPKVKVDEPSPKEPPPKVTKREWKDQNFVGDTPIDEYLDNRDKFNALLNAVGKYIYENSSAVDPVALRTDVLQGIPEVVGKFVSGMMALRTMANEFYETHSDLKPYRNLVAAAANNLSAQHPDWTMSQVMEQSAVLARKTLGLRQRAISRKPKESPPGTKPVGTRKTQTPTMTGVQKEIEEVLNLD